MSEFVKILILIYFFHFYSLSKNLWLNIGLKKKKFYRPIQNITLTLEETFYLSLGFYFI